MNSKQIARRLIQMVIVLIGISFITFALIYMAPGDPVRAMYSSSGVIPSEEVMNQTREAMGLNKPFIVQYFDWLTSCLHGDFGTSYSSGKPVIGILMDRLIPTLKLAFLSLIIMLIVAVPSGILAAVKQNKFADYLVEDHKIRTFLKKKLYSAGVSKIEIERASDRVKIIIYTAKPGVVIGKGGAEIEKVKAELAKFTDKKLVVDIKEIKRPDKDAQLVAENIALQLENRISFRRAMKSCMSRTMKAGALGVKTSVSGRLGGADMARTEFYSEGTIPLQTLRADIDYGFAEADTTYGKVGVKVWIYKGEVLPTKETKEGSDK